MNNYENLNNYDFLQDLNVETVVKVVCVTVQLTGLENIVRKLASMVPAILKVVYVTNLVSQVCIVIWNVQHMERVMKKETVNVTTMGNIQEKNVTNQAVLVGQTPVKVTEHVMLPQESVNVIHCGLEWPVIPQTAGVIQIVMVSMPLAKSHQKEVILDVLTVHSHILGTAVSLNVFLV